MNRPLVSVIIAAYNCEETIERTLLSLYEDKLKDWECIIVDDYSKDNTILIIEKFMQQDKRIKLIKSKENLGAAQARNKAIAIARGKYIAILDSDDININDRLYVESTFLEQNSEYSFVSSNVIYFNESTKWFKEISSKQINKYNMIKSNQVSHSTLMIKKEVIDEVGGYPSYRRCQDYAMLLEVCSNSDNKGFLLNKKLVEYNCDINNFLRRTKKARLTEFFIRIKAYRKMKIGIINYVYAIKPLILICIPRQIYIKYQMKNNIYI